jgi:hypothetical protein
MNSRDHEIVLVWKDERGNEICRSTPLTIGDTRIAVPLDAFCVDLMLQSVAGRGR